MTSLRKQYDSYINSERWRLKRQAFFRSDPANKKCAGCGYAGPGLHVHHRTYVNLGDEPLEDLVTVCQRCHALVHEGIDSWSPKLSTHTDNVLAEIRRKIESGLLQPTRPKVPQGFPRQKKIKNPPKVKRDTARIRERMPQGHDEQHQQAEDLNERRRQFHAALARQQAEKRARRKAAKEKRQARVRADERVHDPNAVVFERHREIQKASTPKVSRNRATAAALRKRREKFVEMERLRNEHYRRLRLAKDGE